MPATASTPTAMRWRSSSRAAALLLASALLAGCVTRTERFYVPTEGAPRLDQNAVREESERFVRAECPRLMGDATSATGATTLKLTVAPGGAVREVRIERPSPDPQIDGIFGSLAAQLDLPPSESTGGDWTARVRMGYSCAPGTGAATFEVL
jgi:outer membrane biosynthesis protein TonB